MRHGPQSPGETVKLTVSPDTLKPPGAATPNTAETGVTAVPVLSTDPASRAAGEPMIRLRQGTAGCPGVAGLALHGSGRVLAGGTSINWKG
jgi:hypothetical protein